MKQVSKEDFYKFIKNHPLDIVYNCQITEPKKMKGTFETRARVKVGEKTTDLTINGNSELRTKYFLNT